MRRSVGTSGTNPVSKLRMAFRLTTARVGLAMVLLPTAWLAGCAWWRFTRYWIPLEMPVSLSPGHIRTPEFQVNVEGSYTIGIGLPAGSELVIMPCPDGSDYCQASIGVLTASWVLSKAGKVVASGRREPTPPYYTQGLGGIGGFHAARGSYVLDLEILKDENRVSTEQPYLMVYEAGGSYFKAGDQLASAFMTFLLFGPIGICALVISGTIRRLESEAFIRRFPLTLPGPLPGEPLARPQRALLRRPKYPRLKRRPNPPQRASLSTAVLLTVIIFQLIVIVMCILQSWAWVLPRGLLVRLVRPDTYAQPSPGIQPLVVRVAPGPEGHPLPLRELAARCVGKLNRGAAEGTQPASAGLARVRRSRSQRRVARRPKSNRHRSRIASPSRSAAAPPTSMTIRHSQRPPT